MKILCAVDFTASSALAGRAAARLAAVLGAELHLLHAQHLPVLSLRPDPGAHAAQTQRRRALLDTLAAQLATLAKAAVTPVLAEGLPDEAIVARAEDIGAELIVIGAVGDRPHAEWNLGSVAMRVIKSSPLPVLVAREEASLERWAGGHGALRVLVGVDPRAATHAPLAALAPWRAARALEVCAGHVYLPGSERSRDASDEHERALAEDVSRCLPSGAVQRVRVLAGFGRVAEHLLDLAASESADLLVVGTHHRKGWNRWVHGSVSLDIVASARRNALVIPLLPPAVPRAEARELQRVLVPIDFSELSARAVNWAVRLLPPKGTLQLAHVLAPYVAASAEFGTYVPLPPPSAEELARERAELERKLFELVPQGARDRGLVVQVEVLSGFDPATQIANCAERVGSDLICMPTHGRSGLTRALLGSVAQGVMRRSRVPVLIVPTPEGRRP